MPDLGFLGPQLSFRSEERTFQDDVDTTVSYYLSMDTLTQSETHEFLKLYYSGIISEGLLTPLLKMSEATRRPIAAAAKSFYKLQVSGVLPQTAVHMMSPRLPQSVALLISLGFENSNLDFVLADLIDITASQISQNPESYSALHEKHSTLTNDEICTRCARGEIDKLFRRATAEKAQLVWLEHRDGFLRQKFASVKFVEIIEPAIPAVFDSIQKLFAELAQSDIRDDVDALFVKPLGDGEYQVSTLNQILLVSFVNPAV